MNRRALTLPWEAVDIQASAVNHRADVTFASEIARELWVSDATIVRPCVLAFERARDPVGLRRATYADAASDLLNAGAVWLS